MLLVAKEGVSRTVVLLTESFLRPSLEETLFVALAGSQRATLLETGVINSRMDCARCIGELTDLLREQGIKSCSLVSFGRACAVALLAAAAEYRHFRTLAFINPEISFGASPDHLDCRNFLHRVQPPSYVLCGNKTRGWAAAEQLSSRLPNSLLFKLAGGAAEISGYLEKLALMPSRAPQRGSSYASNSI